jgi:regulator of protease activity HflC (stomatin/prohibitin superfamily)
MNIVDIIRAAAGFAWIAAIGLAVLALVRTGRSQNSKGIGSTAVVVLVVAAILSTLGAGLVYVESNERGVVKTVRAGGVRPEALNPGLHWILPIVEQEVRDRSRAMTRSAPVQKTGRKSSWMLPSFIKSTQPK